MMMNSYRCFLALALAIAMVSVDARGGPRKNYLNYGEESTAAIRAVDQMNAGKIVQCVNWAKHSNSELIKKLTHDSGLHLFTKKYPACPINHMEGKLRGRTKKNEDGVLLTGRDSLEMCQTIGKLMEMGRLPPDTAGIESSNLVLLNVGASTSRATDMHVAHWLGFESYNYEYDRKEYEQIEADWKFELASSERTHIVQAACVGHIEGGEGTIQMEKKGKKNKKTTVEVPATSLDYNLRDNRQKTVAFLHIDVADQEYEVLKGAYGILQADKPAILFQHSANLDGGSGSRALCYIKNLGYDCGFIDHTKSGSVVCTHPEQYHYKPTIGKGKKRRGKRNQENQENNPAAAEAPKEKQEQ